MTIEPVLRPRDGFDTATRCPACHVRIDLADLLAPLLAGAAPGSVYIVPIIVTIAADKVNAISKIADGIEFDSDRFQLRVGGSTYNLTRQASQLLRYFMAHPRRTLSREAIFNAVWGSDALAHYREVDNYVCHLRRLLPAGKDMIVAVHGIGYRFEPLVEEVRPSVDRASTTATHNGHDGKNSAEDRTHGQRTRGPRHP